MSTPHVGARHRPERLYPLLMPLLSALLRIRYSVRYGGRRLPRHGPVLIVANHVHRLDAVVFASAAFRCGRRPRFLALADLWDVPGLRWLLRHGRMIPVHRGQGPQRMARDGTAALDAGEAVLVYPEGHLPRPDAEAPAQPGAGLLALSTDAPVVPMAMWGLGPARTPGRRLRPSIGVVIGAPCDLSAWAGRVDRVAAQEVAVALLSAVRTLLGDAQQLAERRDGDR